jgi:hypothetical protein
VEGKNHGKKKEGVMKLYEQLVDYNNETISPHETSSCVKNESHAVIPIGNQWKQYMFILAFNILGLEGVEKEREIIGREKKERSKVNN